MTATAVGQEVTIKVPQWLQRNNGFASRDLDGVITRETAKAIYFEGSASTRPADACHRCRQPIGHGTSLDSTVSRLVGYGPDCSEYLGIPRDFPESVIEELRERVKITTAWQGWLPKGSIDIEVVGQAFTPEPEFDEVDGVFVEERKDVVKLTVVGKVIQVRAPFAWKDRIKDELNGRKWDAGAKVWTIPASPTSAVAALMLFTPALCQYDEAFQALLDRAADRVKAAAHKDATSLPEIPLTATPAWLHQKQAYWFGEQLDALGLFMDMGTGKSKVAVDLIVNRGHKRVLIVCPNSVVGVWPKQFAIHAGSPVRVVAPRTKTKSGASVPIPERAEEVQNALTVLDRSETTLVVVVNYESVWREPLGELLLKQQWDLVLLDESHRIKKPGGKASQFVARLGKRAAHRLVLTGTPMPHSPLDVYAQFRFLDPGIFGTSFATFRARYAVMGGYQGHEVLGFQNQDELAERMYSVGFRVEASDVLDLIPPVHDVRTCTLEPAARKIYASLYDDLISDVGDGTVTAANALVRLLRLQQVTSGALPVEDPDSGESELVVVSEAKRELLADTIEDLATDEPIVVFCRFSWELRQVEEVALAQGRRYGELSGKRKDGLADDATMSTDIDVLGVQIQSGGTGIDLSRAHYIAYMATGFALGDYEQSLKRADRPGQKHRVIFYHLHCENTIDEGIYTALANRKSVVDFVMGLGS